MERIPFSAEFRGGMIILSGDMDGSDDVLQKFSVLSGYVGCSGLKMVVVDAQNMRLPSGGLDMWVSFVANALHNIWLLYLPSQLSSCLKYGYEDDLPYSLYPETDDEAEGLLRGMERVAAEGLKRFPKKVEPYESGGEWLKDVFGFH